MELVRKPTRIYWARGTDPNTLGIWVLVSSVLVFWVQEVLNFERWEEERATKGILAQDPVVESEMDCFRD